MVTPPEPVFKIPDLAHLEKHVDFLISERESGRLKAKTATDFVHLSARVKGAKGWHRKLEQAEDILRKKKKDLKPGQFERATIQRAIYHGKLLEGYADVSRQLIDPIVRAFVATHGYMTSDHDRNALVRDVQRIYQAYGHMVENHLVGVPNFQKAWRDDKEVPYIVHTATVAKYMAERGALADHIIAALHHDSVEDTELTVRDLKVRYDREAQRGFSISKTVSLLSKPAIRMQSRQDADLLVSPPQSTSPLRIVMPGSDSYKMAETGRDKRLREKHRSFLNRMQIERLLPQDEGIYIGKKALEEGQFSEEWVALNIKLADVLANLQTYSGKVERKLQEASKTHRLSDVEKEHIRKQTIEKMVRERREFIDLYKKVCPSMWNSLDADIRTAYLDLVSRENGRKPQPLSATSLISPGYASPFVVSPARAGLTSANFPDVPDAMGFQPNIHYVLKGNSISPTQLEVLFPELMVFGRKPTHPKTILKQELKNELMQHVKAAFPKADPERLARIVQPVRSLLYENDSHRFIGFRIHLDLLPRPLRHSVFDSIVQHTATAMTFKPLHSLDPDFERVMVNKFGNGMRWQPAVHLGPNTYSLLMPKTQFGHDSGMLKLVLDRLKSEGRLEDFIWSRVNHPNPSFTRFSIRFSEEQIQRKIRPLAKRNPQMDAAAIRTMASSALLKDLSRELKAPATVQPDLKDSKQYGGARFENSAS